MEVVVQNSLNKLQLLLLFNCLWWNLLIFSSECADKSTDEGFGIDNFYTQATFGFHEVFNNKMVGWALSLYYWSLALEIYEIELEYGRSG